MSLLRYLSAFSLCMVVGSHGDVAFAQQLDWAIQAGGPDHDQGWAIAVDAGGNSYVTGYFGNTAKFGAGESNETTLVSSVGRDIFVAKYDRHGRLVWATQTDGTLGWGLGITVDAARHSYVTGYFLGTATFGPGEVHETTLTSTGTHSIFVAKYDPDGVLLWAVRAGGQDIPVISYAGVAIAVDRQGHSYLTGQFSGVATFGSEDTEEVTLTSVGSEDVFVASYDRTGALVWVRQAGGGGFDAGHAIAVDVNGNSYLTGEFAGFATFGSGDIHETILIGGGVGDIFVAKYDPTGALLWAKEAVGASGLNVGRGIAVDRAGHSYVAGMFTTAATFGFAEDNQTTLFALEDRETFVAKYDGNGGLVWAKQANGAGNDGAWSITVDRAGSSYITGTFANEATFGLGEANQITLTRVIGVAAGFVAKYESSGLLVWARQGGGFGIAVDRTGRSHVTGTFAESSPSATFGLGEPNETTLISEPIECTPSGACDSPDDIFLARYSKH